MEIHAGGKVWDVETRDASPLGDEGAHRAEPVAVGERAQDHPPRSPAKQGLR